MFVNEIQIKVEKILEENKIMPVGTGFIDLIATSGNELGIVDQLSKLGVQVVGLSLWCHFIEKSQFNPACPHGMGGPQDFEGKGFYSECNHLDPALDLFEINGISDYNFESLFNVKHQIIGPDFASKKNQVIRDYIQYEFKDEEFWSPCLRLAFHLGVPDHWRRARYMV